MKKLRDVCFDMHQGINTVADKVQYYDKGYPILQSKNITKGVLDLKDVRYVNKETYDNYKLKYNPQGNDILIANIGTIGKSIIIKECNEFLIAWNIFLIKVNQEKIFSKYLKYFFDYLFITKYYDKFLTGGTVKFINKKTMSEIDIPEISIEEQKNIANKLDKVQEIIDIRKRQIEDLDKLIKSQFVEMFENETNEVELKDVCSFINGDRGKNYPSADKISKDKIGVPFINAGLLLNNLVDWKNMNYISKETFDKLGSGKIQKDDILYCLRGSLGKHAIIDFEDNGAIASSLVILRCNKEKINPYFLLIQLDMDEIILQQNQANNGSSQPNLSASSVKQYKIKLPDMEIQKEFVEKVKLIDKQKFEIEKSLTETEQLMQSLMNEYFGG